jgi:hypothetical protein
LKVGLQHEPPVEQLAKDLPRHHRLAAEEVAPLREQGAQLGANAVVRLGLTAEPVQVLQARQHVSALTLTVLDGGDQRRERAAHRDRGRQALDFLRQPVGLLGQALPPLGVLGGL